MLTAVVPALKEEHRLCRVIESLLSIPDITRIYIILNGSDELTQGEAKNYFSSNAQRMTLVSFDVPLGIDVPRAVGANLSFLAGADYVMFIDGDMAGKISAGLVDLITTAIKNKLDLALLDCYPNKTDLANTEPLFYWRHLLNKELGLFERIKLATPSHGPHLVSRRMLSVVPWKDFAVPPTLLFHAVQQQLRIEVAGEIPHIQLGSSIKGAIHNKLVVDTIIGDCIEALCMWQHQPRVRSNSGKIYLGYNDRRRFDLLEQFFAGRFM